MEKAYHFRFVLVSFRWIIKALPVTLLLTMVPLAAGLLFGIPCALIRRFQIRFLAFWLRNISRILKGIPSVLFVLMVNYLVLKPIDYLAQYYAWARPLQSIDKVYIGLIALSVLGIVQITETAISALIAVDEGQYEAAYAIGLTKSQALQRIILPQAVPIALPMLCNNVIGLLKSTSIVYLISVNDILSAAINSAAVNFRYLEAYIAASIVYWGMCFLVEQLFNLWEKKLKKAGGVA